MTVINVRKARAGTDSAGHRWPADGAVVAVPVEHALALTRIPDGGFSIVETPLEENAAPEPAELAEVIADTVAEAGAFEIGNKARVAKPVNRKP